jgi:hypothetical protein
MNRKGIASWILGLFKNWTASVTMLVSMLDAIPDLNTKLSKYGATSEVK